MKIVIYILNYVDTVDVLIDGLKIDIKRLSFFSKAEYEHNLECGIHEIAVVKKSQIMDSSWKKSVLLDWISCLSGVPSWTLAEKALDQRKNTLFFKVEVEKETHIYLRLTEDGFEILESTNDILDVIKRTETCETARKRIRNAYKLPAIILSIIIEFLLLIVVGFFVVNTQYIISIIVFILAIFWMWLVCNMLLKRKSDR